MKSIALTGHTRGLGKLINMSLLDRGHYVTGFSLSNGYDLRDYSVVGKMITEINKFDWFINCAKPDYTQTQILYRLMSSTFSGKVLNIGSPVVHTMPEWKDLSLLEYVTQKTALYHAHKTLTNMFPNRLFMWEPVHTHDMNYITDSLTVLGL